MNHLPVRAMVMAAGAGTRLQPLTHGTPKPLVPIANRPVLEYTVENLRRHGITDLILNLHSHPEQIEHHFGDGSAWGVKISYSHEPTLLGTAGGVKKVEDFLRQGTFLVLSGDGLTDINLTQLLAFHRRRKAFATIALKAMDTRFDYGVTFMTPQGRIQRFVEKPSWSDVFSDLVNTGIYVFEPQALLKIPRGQLYDFGHQFWPKVLKQRLPIYGMETQAYWCDVGNLNEYRRAQRDTLDKAIEIPFVGRQIKKGVWIGAKTVIGRGVRFDAPCLIGLSCRIETNAVVGPYTVIGRGGTIGAQTVLRHSTLWDNVKVGKNSKLENCIVTHTVDVPSNLSARDASFTRP